MNIDQVAWVAGFTAGVLADLKCPYTTGTREAWSWANGWIEGRASEMKDAELPQLPAE